MRQRHLLDVKMGDGTRWFAELPQTWLWYDLRDHIARLDGAVIAGFITDHVTEAWIDFTYCGHTFRVNDQNSNYWFFVDDQRCPEEVLQRVVTHCSALLCGSEVAWAAIRMEERIPYDYRPKTQP